MRKVTCGDCGRVYDYDKDDFCPKCGSFNTPTGGSTVLERELLGRFEGNRSQQAAEGAQARERQKNKSAGEEPRRSYAYAPSSTRQVPMAEAQSQYWHGGEPCEEARPKGARRGLVGLLVAGIVLLFALVIFVAATADSKQKQIGPPAMESHQLYEDFSMGALRVSVDDVRWLALPEGSRLRREGYDILLVDVYITGGSAFDKKFPMGEVYLAMPGGWYIPVEGDEVAAVRLKEASVYAVELRDAVWEDPLMGSFVFYVPEGEDEAVLCLEQVEKKLFSEEGALTAIHEVPLELPEREAAW